MKQRVSYKDGLEILKKNIENNNYKQLPTTTYVYDYAGGSSEFVRRDIVEKVIKRLTKSTNEEICPRCGDTLMKQVASNNLQCVNCGLTIR